MDDPSAGNARRKRRDEAVSIVDRDGDAVEPRPVAVQIEYHGRSTRIEGQEVFRATPAPVGTERDHSREASAPRPQPAASREGPARSAGRPNRRAWNVHVPVKRTEHLERVQPNDNFRIPDFQVGHSLRVASLRRFRGNNPQARRR